MEWDKQQLQVINTTFRNVVVEAAAASGKTALIVGRVDKLIERGIPAHKICIISYTNMAVEELRSRIKHKYVNITTLHGIVNKSLQFNDIDTSKYIVNKDFDGLLKRAVMCPSYYFPEFEVIIIDEFQDMGSLELKVLDKFKAKQHMLIGDPRQRIFAFKNKDFNALRIFEKNKYYRTMYLNNNYRNPPNILKFGEKFIERQGYSLQHPALQENGEIWDGTNHSTFNTILEDILIYPEYKKWAIICYTNAQLEKIRKILMAKVIPFTTFKVEDFRNQGDKQRVLDSDRVKLLTAHSAKGLEFPYVGVVGVKAYDEETDRLCYVAATRAKEHLYWVDMPKLSDYKIRK